MGNVERWLHHTYALALAGAFLDCTLADVWSCVFLSPGMCRGSSSWAISFFRSTTQADFGTTKSFSAQSDVSIIEEQVVQAFETWGLSISQLSEHLQSNKNGGWSWGFSAKWQPFLKVWRFPHQLKCQSQGYVALLKVSSWDVVQHTWALPMHWGIGLVLRTMLRSYANLESNWLWESLGKLTADILNGCGTKLFCLRTVQVPFGWAIYLWYKHGNACASGISNLKVEREGCVWLQKPHQECDQWCTRAYTYSLIAHSQPHDRGSWGSCQSLPVQ